MSRSRALVALPFVALFAVVGSLSACTSDTSGTGTASTGGSTTFAPVTTSGTESSAASTSTSGPIAPSTAASVTTTGVGTACAGASGIPANADVGDTITGDIDGDLVDDTITEYSLDGVPHVHSRLATGGQSDAEVPIGNADHVSISFEDFDYSLGAATKPPVAVLAIGATQAGTAAYTFLTNTPQYCIQPWHDTGGTMWVGRLSMQGPYEGLSCEIAAGNRFYAVNEAVPDGAGNLTVTQTVFHHNFTRIDFDPPLASFTVPDTPANQHQYGDFFDCDHDPLFP
jgi:hypothetical protein